MSELVRVCRLCHTEFVFTEGEQAFYFERGYRAPEYCPSCRDARRATRTRKQIDASNAPQGQFATHCSVCGQQTTVPFRPDPARPVLCDSCFAERRQAHVPR